MGIDREVGIYLAIDAGDSDLYVGDNKGGDLFFRPYCERVNKDCTVYLSNKHRPVAPQSFSEKMHHVFTQVDENRMRLSDEQVAFLAKLDVKYTLTLVYLEWWS